jgi:hypothetical protein
MGRRDQARLQPEETMLEIAVLSALLAVEPATLNAKVVEFARSKVGEQVGDGQCAALAVEALRAAGARGQRGRGGWGEALASVKDAEPGDILQFEDVVVVHRTARPDGAVVTLTARYPHHTAIVAAVRKRGKRVVFAVLHQNASVGDNDPGAKRVQQWTIDLADLRGGSLTAYRPTAAPPDDRPSAPAP